jgi:hypothetical protein
MEGAIVLNEIVCTWLCIGATGTGVLAGGLLVLLAARLP